MHDDPNKPPYAEAFGEDAELDLEMQAELEGDRKATQAIRREVVEALRQAGVDVDTLDLEGDESTVPIEEIDTSAVDWVSVGIKDGVEAVSGAIYFSRVRLPDAEFDERAEEDTFEVKADTQLTLQTSRIPQEAYEVLRSFLNEHVQVRLEPQREAELLNKVAAEREKLSQPPGPLS